MIKEAVVSGEGGKQGSVLLQFSVDPAAPYPRTPAAIVSSAKSSYWPRLRRRF